MIKIIEKNTSDLIAYENNARKNDTAVEYVANSIKEFGIKNPIIIDSNNIIIAGHTRIKACEKLGIEKVPCIVADDLTEEQVKAFRIADNSTAQIAEWDLDKLQLELDSIDMDMLMYGCEEQVAAIERLIDENKEAEEDEYIIEEDLEPRVKLGEIWRLGNHRLMCGDSTKKEDVEALMNGAVADMVFTDPPYNVAIENSQGMTIKNDSMSDSEFLEFLTKAFNCMFDNLKSGGSYYIWYASKEHINFESAIKENNQEVRQQLIWVKNCMVLGRQDYQWKHEPCLYGWKDGAAHYFIDDRAQTTVLEFNKPVRNGEHPTMKPLELVGYQIKNSSRVKEIVLDLFGGSGSTLIACEQLDRKCYMMEFDEKYATVIIDRWEKFTGLKAEKIKENK